VKWKLNSEEFDDNYKDYWRVQDTEEVNKVVEEAIQNA